MGKNQLGRIMTEEQDLADEYWRGLYDKYLQNGGTLDFSDWFKLELGKSSKTEGIKSILRI